MLKLKNKLRIREADSGGGVGGGRPPFFFAITWKNYKLCYSEVELIINNAPLTNFYPNTIKTCLTPNHVFFDRQLLYSSNTTSTAVSNLTVLSSTTDKINRISNDFLDRWSHVYIINLRQTQRTSKLNVNSLKINVNDIVLVFYEKVLRHF